MRFYISIGYVIFIGFVLISNCADARIIYFGNETEQVTVAYGGPTIFRFPEDVKTISQARSFTVVPANSENPNYSLLSVTPRFSKGENKVTFILASGEIVTTNIVIVPKALPEKTDSIYDFKPKESLIENQDSSAEGSQVSELELMRAMIRWDKVIGYNVRILVRSVDSGNKEISARLIRVYTGPKYNGYIYEIKNLSKKKSFAIDLKSLSLGKPNMALLSQVDDNILKPKKSNATFLRIVAKPSSIYRTINLPIAKI